MTEQHDLDICIAAARRQHYDVGAAEHERSFARIAARLEGRAHPWAWLGLAVAVPVLCLGLFLTLRATPLTYSVHGGVSARALAFSDGSQVELASGGSLSVLALHERGAELRLHAGHALVRVQPRRGASWVVQAGPYRVRVTGTAFALDWSEASQRFSIEMQHGSVVVTGPQLEGGEASLQGTEHLVVIASERAPAELAKADQASTSVAAASVPAPTRIAPDASRAVSSRVRAHDWQRQVASGSFETVLQELDRVGVRATLRRASLDDLAAVADAARYARRSELARRALLALRRRFPNAPPSRDAAFLLARLASGADALQWYRRYLEEQPHGVYASEALGRAMTLTMERGDLHAAAATAAHYLARAPEGPYANVARELVAHANVAAAQP